MRIRISGPDDKGYSVDRHYMLPEETQELIRQGKLSEEEIASAIHNLEKASKYTMRPVSYLDLKARVIPREENLKYRAEREKEEQNG